MPEHAAPETDRYFPETDRIHFQRESYQTEDNFSVKADVIEILKDKQLNQSMSSNGPTKMHTINESKINSSYINTKRETQTDQSILDTSAVMEGNMLLGALNERREELSSSSWLKSQNQTNPVQVVPSKQSPVATPVKTVVYKNEQKSAT